MERWPPILLAPETGPRAVRASDNGKRLVGLKPK